jgi:uncharacterized 2Fe-2S/4Fe-4S cluster protein (DUF4445 family)
VEAEGELSAPDEAEERLLAGRKGQRLACQARFLGPAEVTLGEARVFAAVKAMGWSAPYAINPGLELASIPALDSRDGRDSLRARGLRRGKAGALNQLAALDLSRRGGYALSYAGELLAAVPESGLPPEEGPLAAAFDLGTTGLALAVIDPFRRVTLALETALNPQTAAGGDVISRITYADRPEKLEELQELALKGLRSLVGAALGEAGARRLALAAVSGNTTMQHLLAGVDPRPIAQAPYRPVFTGAADLSHLAERLGLAPWAKVFCPPSISAFVGGDIVSGIMAVDLPSRPGTVMFIDIGTNGELVLSRKGRLVATSCAAGPALEGMNVICGSRAVTGAVDRFDMPEDGSRSFTTIGGAEATGICGSGLIDICAALVKAGLINKSGRMAAPEGYAGKAALAPDGRFYLTGRVFLDQKDVRQVQLAKGAIAAAMRMLLRKEGLDTGDIDEIVVAGSFGYHLRAESLKAISLIPRDYEGPVTFVGNSSLAGSARIILNRDSLALSEELARKTEVVELGFDPKFQEVFLSQLGF